MSDLNKIINEQRERIAQLEKENTLLLAKALPECNCEGLKQRIAEMETELDKAYNDLANFEGYPEEVSALRHDIERRKQRYKNILLDRAEWKKRAESAEKRLAEVERELEDANANLVEWNDLTLESQGVVGYHLNGDIAEWDEFEFTTASPLVAAEDWKNKFTIEQQIKALEEALHTVANQYNGTDSTEWAIGANHVLRLFVKHTSRLRQQLSVGS